MNEYQQLREKLFSLVTDKTKLRLENVSFANAHLKYPNRNFKSIHIAGTNGKGSVANKIAKALSLSGYKTALYTSPHISSYRERLVIDGENISQEQVMIYLKELFKLQKSLGIYLSFFEITTLAAFLYFSQNKVDFAVIETGLGGRLDATNIITPILSIITSINFDHTNLLGNTLAKIAYEKAHIIKPNVPVVVGPSSDLAPIKQKAKENKCSYYKAKKRLGFYDFQNQEIARTSLELISKEFPLKKEAIKKALPFRPKGRFEILDSLGPKAIILDVAHNVEAINELKKTINIFFPKEKIRIIFGLSKHKDIDGCLKIIKTFAHYIHIISANNIKALPKLEIKKALLKIKFTNFDMAKDIKSAVFVAQDRAKKNNEVLLICGSFYILDEVKYYLNRD